MSPDELWILMLKLKALRRQRNRALRKLAATAGVASASLASFGAAISEAVQRDEEETFTFHPDLVELEMKHAAWNPEGS